MASEWEIKSRGEICSATGRAFGEGESFYTLLYREKDGFRREDLCEEAFKQRDAQNKPFSFWRSKFEPPAPPPPEALGKETAEDLLRRYIDENQPHHANARYILALMLERKKLFKHKDTQVDGDEKLLIYEHAKTGEVFMIHDPQLRLDQIAAVQEQVAELLK